MRSLLTHTLLTAALALTIGACAKDTPKAPAPAPAAPSAESATEKPTEEAASAPAKGEPAKPAIETKTEVAQPPAGGGGLDDEAKTKLAKVYKEIYCAQRRGESEKLLDIYTAHGFQDPEAWTKTWTKAAEDGAWVAKTTHDAIRACSNVSPPEAPPSAE